MSAPDASSFHQLVVELSGAFTAPTFVTFESVLTGWMLAVGRHTITGVIQASGAMGTKHHTSFHRLFRTAKWNPEDVGLLLLGIVIGLVAPTAKVVAILDDTLSRHTGKRIRGASMHHDPLLSTRAKPVYHWGHVWVVLSIAITVTSWNKTFALPVLVRLYRSEKTCKRERRKFRKKTELAAEMIAALSRALPDRSIQLLADAAYVNGTVVRTLPANVHFTGRGRMDAMLYTRPTRNPHGRPRIRGERLPSPKEHAERRRGWERVTVAVYGKTVSLQVKTIDALWYRVGHSRMMRLVLVRGWPGHKHDDVLCTTDLSQSAKDIIGWYCLRWSLECTFWETKGKLGLEHAQTRTTRAVERTTPMALWAYTLVVVWFLKTVGTGRNTLLPVLPWYRKHVPAFSDMLASLRGALWQERLLTSSLNSPADQKAIEPLLRALRYAA